MAPWPESWPFAAMHVVADANEAGGCRCEALTTRAQTLLALSDADSAAERQQRLQIVLAPGLERGLLGDASDAASAPISWQVELKTRAAPCSRTLHVEAQPHGTKGWLLNLSDLSDVSVLSTKPLTPRPIPTSPHGPTDPDRALTALRITEAIPVGTYTMVLRPGAALASFEFMSERFLELTGLKREEALEDPLKGFACVHPDDFDTWVQWNAEAFTNRTPFFGQTRLLVNGDVRWITAESVPRDLPDGSVVWEGVLIDVTERVLAQQQLEEQRRDLERILDNIPISIAFLDLQQEDPAITFLNSTFQHQLGYTLADIPSLSRWFPLAYPDPDYREEVLQRWQQAVALHASGEGAIAQNDDYRITSKSGQKLEMLINSVELDDRLVFTFVDVTAFRQAQRRQLSDMDEKLRISLTASAIGHEIRQPLSTILLNSKLALEGLGQETATPEDLRERLTVIDAESQRLSLIAERIGLLLRNVHTEKVSLDLREVVDSCVLQLQARVREQEVQFCLEQPDTAVPILGDSVQLQLAICNLLRNSLDALRLHHTAAPRLLLSVRQQSDGISLVVADNGPGFPTGLEPLQPLISLKDDGYGIGLFVVQLSLQNHGGTIRIGRSTQLGGAEVQLHFPIANRAS